MEQNVTLLDFLTSIFNLFVNVFNFLGNSLLNGLNFFITLFTSIPKVLFEVFNELPSFYKTGLVGIFCCLLLVVFLKIVSLVRS